MGIKKFEMRFFEHLTAEFEANFSASKDPQAALARAIIERGKDRSALTASDVYALEILLLGLEPTETLIQRAPALRLKFRELVGDQAFAVYKPADPPPPDKFKDDDARRPLLADLHEILHFLHWSYLFSPIRENLRTHLIQVALGFILLYSGVGAGLIFLFYYFHLPFFALFTAVIYAGLIGGFISSLRRMQSISTTGDPLASIYDLRNARYQFWFAPLTGGIFAVVLLLFFLAGVLQGVVFPKFPELSFDNLIHPREWAFTYQLLPTSSVQFALLLLWSFIAGFAERFVPDAIDRLVDRGNQAQSTAAVSVTVGPGTGDGKGLPGADGSGKDGKDGKDKDDKDKDQKDAGKGGAADGLPPAGAPAKDKPADPAGAPAKDQPADPAAAPAKDKSADPAAAPAKDKSADPAAAPVKDKPADPAAAPAKDQPAEPPKP